MIVQKKIMNRRDKIMIAFLSALLIVRVMC